MVSQKLSSRVDLATNVLTIIIALVFIGLVAQRYLIATEKSAVSPTLGSKVSVEGFDPSKNSKNVLLVLMKGCRFCEESMDFYKDLIPRSLEQNQKVVAIFSEDTKDAEAYLEHFGITDLPILYVRSLSSIDVSGTPTVVVTNNAGEITGVWDGKLSKDMQDDLYIFLASY